MARAYISSRQTEDFSLSDVARAIHVSPFYLCKIFKKATGLTFVEFRNRLRIESAMKLLANPNQSVSEIAYSVGFQALTQFNRLFRRIVGQSPTTFRCSLREARVPPIGMGPESPLTASCLTTRRVAAARWPGRFIPVFNATLLMRPFAEGNGRRE